MKKLIDTKTGALLVLLSIGVSAGAFSNDYEDVSDLYAQSKFDRCIEATQGTGAESGCDIYK